MGLLRNYQQHGSHRHQGSEGKWRVHPSRCVPHQDPYEASYQGWRQDDVWQGDQGEGETSQDYREGFPSRCIEEADLSGVVALGTFQRLVAVGIPRSRLERWVVRSWSSDSSVV